MLLIRNLPQWTILLMIPLHCLCAKLNNRMCGLFEEDNMGNSLPNHPIFVWMSPWRLRFPWNFDLWQILTRQANPENFMVTALMVQDLLRLEILPDYDCWAQNPPLWIYILFNKSWTNGPIIMKFGT